MNQRNLYIKTFGCQMNERDSEIMAQLMLPSGFLVVEDIEAADLILVNTCSIRAKAEQKVYSLLGQLRQNKSRNNKLMIGVTGCVAQQEGTRIQQKMPHVDLVIGTQQIYMLPELVEQLDQSGRPIAPAVDLAAGFSIPSLQQIASPSPASPVFRKFVTIMQGCNNYCSYCVVPFTRGRETSRPMADILFEVESLVAAGIREITLLGQNVNSYGRTNAVADHDCTFAELLHQTTRIPGLERLRFTTSNPKDLSDELLRCFAEIPVLCPQFHLPVQSGSDSVLRMMNRRYTVDDYLRKIKKLRQYRPDIALSTDVIVGFPGETEEDFTATLQLLETVRFHSSFSFKYSDRPGTRASEFADKVDEQVKSERLSRFQQLQDEISLARNREFLQEVVAVMVEGPGKNGVVQGRTLTNHIVHIADSSGRQLRPGHTVNVRINKAGRHSLAGVLEK